jgi:hypothetical protein
MIWLFCLWCQAMLSRPPCRHTYLELLASVEDLAWCHGTLRVEDVPVVDGLCADERKRGLADPSPELNVLLMAVCLQTLLGLEVEELQRPSLRLEGYDGLCQVHDGAVGADRSSDDIVCVLQINDVLVRLERLEGLSARLPVAGHRGSIHVHSSATISMPAVTLVSFPSPAALRARLCMAHVR